MLTLEKHRLYDLKIQLSLLPQLGHSKIRSSIPSSLRAKFIGVEHFGQAGRRIVRGIERISSIALPSCYRREFSAVSSRAMAAFLGEVQILRG